MRQFNDALPPSLPRSKSVCVSVYVLAHTDCLQVPGQSRYVVLDSKLASLFGYDTEIHFLTVRRLVIKQLTGDGEEGMKVKANRGRTAGNREMD